MWRKPLGIELDSILFIDRRQAQVGHQAIKAPMVAVDDHKGALLNFLRGNGQADIQVCFQTAADDITNGWVLREKVMIFHLIHAPVRLIRPTPW